MCIPKPCEVWKEKKKRKKKKIGRR
jgi:hypothetical protein